MTKAQEKALNKLITEFQKYYSFGAPEKYELKDKKVTEWEELETVYVQLESGRIGDEGTMAAVVCRDYTAVCIGKNGGYFAHRESGKQARLSLHQAITWGFHCEQLRKKRAEAKK